MENSKTELRSASKNFSGHTDDERIDIFRYYFDRDLESYYTSSVACCYQCIERFALEWPGTTAHDWSLEQGSTDINYFLANSRIQDAFDPEEIQELRQYLTCPNCFEILDGTFYIYEHPFQLPADFEEELSEISHLGETAPFLLMKHPFAEKVHSAITRLGLNCSPTKVSGRLYRARDFDQAPLTELADFGAPPPHKVAEGRFNHAGQPVLYLADSAEAAYKEIARPETKYSIAELELSYPLKILELRAGAEFDGDDQELLQVIAHSPLVAAPAKGEGWSKPEYVFTRLIADCARDSGFDAIRYGSTKTGPASNLVVLNPAACWSGVSLISTSIR